MHVDTAGVFALEQNRRARHGEDPAEQFEHLSCLTRTAIVERRRLPCEIEQALPSLEHGAAVLEPGVRGGERARQLPHEDGDPVQIGAAEGPAGGQALQKGLAGELVPLDEPEALLAPQNLGVHPPDEDDRVRPPAHADRDDPEAQPGVAARGENIPGIAAGRGFAETVFPTGRLCFGMALQKCAQGRQRGGGLHSLSLVVERLDGNTGELGKIALEFGPETLAIPSPFRRHITIPCQTWSLTLPGRDMQIIC